MGNQNYLSAELVAEWHPTKNGDITLDIVTAGSRKKVWWLCASGHEWEASIINRVKRHGCPYDSLKKRVVNDEE